MCDSDRVEKGRVLLQLQVMESGWEGPAGVLVLPCHPAHAPPLHPAPGPEPGISTIYGGQTAGRVQAALQISRYLHTAAGARLLLRRGGGGPATQFLAAAVPGLIVEPRAWTPAAGWDHV